MNKHEFAKWLKAEIAQLHHPDPDTAICEGAAVSVREARRIAESLGYPDLVPPCTTELLGLPIARRLLAECLATIDPPASGPLTVKQAAERLNLSPKTIYDLVGKGRLRCIRIGRTIRIQPHDLEVGTATPGYKHLRL
jgi:excisionase family DNA binding protein